MRRIKMMSLKKATAQFALFFIVAAACQQDNEILNSIDIQNVNSEVASAALINENADIATKLISSLTNTQYAGPLSTMILVFSDSRINGATVTLNSTGTASAPTGQIIIDFPANGATDKNGVIRKGEIKITYAGKRWTPGSYFFTKLTNFYRNSEHIEGTDTTNFINTGADTLQLNFKAKDSIKITFGDGKSIQRKDSLYKTWNRSVNINTGKIDPSRGEWDVTDGGGKDKTKLGMSYDWKITSHLVYDLSCWVSNKVFIPVNGEKTFKVVNTNYAVNYGDGTCDNQITVKLNSREKAITVTEVGN